MKNVYVGLDTAKVMGAAIWFPRQQKAWVEECKGSPLAQWKFIQDLLYPVPEEDVVFVFEKQHNFYNAKTTRSLLERYGFLKFSILGSTRCQVREVSPKVARAYLETSTKKETFRRFIPYFAGDYLTDNHTDALAVAIYESHTDGLELNWSKLSVVQHEVIG
jgi:hypothetical protein